MLVGRPSATQHTKYCDIDEPIPINADHQKIAKLEPQSNDPDYIVVQDRIKDMVEKAPAIINKRIMGACIGINSIYN